MSNQYEPKMTKAYWAKRREKGTLYLEYPICGRRIDGLIVLDDGNTSKEPKSAKHAPKLDELRGKQVIVLQTKRKKLGMGVAGQAIVSRALLILKGIHVRESVALCLEIDPTILPVLKLYGCNAAVVNDSRITKMN